MTTPAGTAQALPDDGVALVTMRNVATFPHVPMPIAVARRSLAALHQVESADGQIHAMCLPQRPCTPGRGHDSYLHEL